MTRRSTSCSRLSWIRSTSHQTAGWNQNSARATSSTTIHGQSRLATCNSSWHATVRCACGSMAKKPSGSRTTGCRRPKPAGCTTSHETRTSARGAISDLIASRSGVRTAGRLRCRSCRSRMAPAHSQPSRASAPAHSSHHTTLPAAGRTAGTGTDSALSTTRDDEERHTGAKASGPAIADNGSARQARATPRQ